MPAFSLPQLEIHAKHLPSGGRFEEAVRDALVEKVIVPKLVEQVPAQLEALDNKAGHPFGETSYQLKNYEAPC
jgi:hypothetical protein